MRRVALTALGLACLNLTSLAAQGGGEIALRDGDFMHAPEAAVNPDLIQIPALKSCDPSRYNLGYISGSGVVGYVVGTNGRADLRSIEVVRHEGVSINSLLSIAQRLLAACQFQPGKDSSGKVAVRVTQGLSFRSALDHPLPRDAASNAAAVPATNGSAGAEADVDEIPAALTCPPPRASGSGRVRFQLVVGRDGKVDPSSLLLLSSSGSNQIDQAARRTLAECRFAPGRKDGVAVPVLIVQGFSFNP